MLYPHTGFKVTVEKVGIFGSLFPGQSAEILSQRVTSSTSLKDAMEGAVYVQVRFCMEVEL